MDDQRHTDAIAGCDRGGGQRAGQVGLPGRPHMPELVAVRGDERGHTRGSDAGRPWVSTTAACGAISVAADIVAGLPVQTWRGDRGLQILKSGAPIGRGGQAEELRAAVKRALPGLITDTMTAGWSSARVCGGLSWTAAGSGVGRPATRPANSRTRLREETPTANQLWRSGGNRNRPGVTHSGTFDRRPGGRPLILAPSASSVAAHSGAA